MTKDQAQWLIARRDEIAAGVSFLLHGDGREQTIRVVSNPSHSWTWDVHWDCEEHIVVAEKLIDFADIWRAIRQTLSFIDEAVADGTDQDLYDRLGATLLSDRLDEWIINTERLIRAYDIVAGRRTPRAIDAAIAARMADDQCAAAYRLAERTIKFEINCAQENSLRIAC